MKRKLNGLLLIFFVVASLGLTTCSLHREIPMVDAEGNMTSGYVTAWPPTDWVWFTLGVVCAIAAVVILVRSDSR